MRKFAVLLTSTALAFSAFGCQAWGSNCNKNCNKKCKMCRMCKMCSCKRGNMNKRGNCSR